ncbi:hypothetical protein EYW47_14815 [Paraburkholderia silviterrae]|uniref:Uncharacterized protein n=1 Tax=Paraburkholderia silviterrae TaxID=2528715 RepID=A0A4R5M9E5_9BURK|nr:hypothetical protein [Paraburkholderia silviterrae]TDG23203.1 hypothetical protein EYW47_14815 [Paraburkholderia silviterrae]
MNQTSPMNSGTAAGATLLLVPVIARIAQAWHIDLAPAVEGSLAVSIVAGAHWLGANVLSPLFAALMVRLNRSVAPAAAVGGYQPRSGVMPPPPAPAVTQPVASQAAEQ